MRKYSIIRQSLFASGLVAAFAGLPLSQAMAQDATAVQTQKAADNQTVPDKAADTWITTKVKSELATTKGVKVSNISVTTSDGVVVLSGTASSSHEKAKAIEVTKNIKGVKSVDASSLAVTAP